MTVTLNSLTLDVEDLIYGIPQIERPAEDTLATAVSNASDTSWRFTTPDLWKRGSLAEYVGSAGAVGELVIMAENHVPGADVVVRRAQVRSTAASSYAAGDVFRKNPMFPRIKVQRFINEIVDSLAPDVWIRTNRSVDINPNRYYYPLNQYDYEVESVWQADTDVDAVGNATFDVSGGASEDLWTCSAHGLAVGDAVRFTAVGTGADGYAVNTVYWVATVPTSSTFQLSATESTTVLEGTGADSSGTWTLEKINTFRYEPLPPDAWEVITGVDSRTSNTNRILRIATYYSDSDTLYYQTKTKPTSSDYTVIPDIMGDFIPYGAMWLLLGGSRVVPPRIDSLRSLPEKMPAAQAMADSRFFRDEFERRKAEYRRHLDADKYPTTYLRRNEVVRR